MAPELGVRIGVATGEVVAERHGADASVLTSQTVGLAGRLEEKGRPGQILVDEL